MLINRDGDDWHEAAGRLIRHVLAVVHGDVAGADVMPAPDRARLGGNEVAGVTLLPDTKYLLAFSVTGEAFFVKCVRTTMP